MWLACCLSPLNSKLSPVRRGYSWMGDHLILNKLGTHVNRSRVVVVGLSCASRVVLRVLRFSFLRKINLSLIHLSFTGPPLVTVFLYTDGVYHVQYQNNVSIWRMRNWSGNTSILLHLNYICWDYNNKIKVEKWVWTDFWRFF